MELNIGDKAPDFALPDALGNKVKLADFSGKEIVLYFYPKDDTPGCTSEACAFRDDIAQFKKSGVAVLGVSPDSGESHVKFAEKYSADVTQIAIAGAEVFNHTYDHLYLTKLTDDQIRLELQNAETILSNLTGTTTQPYFRPPYGDRNSRVLEIAGQNGYQSVYWTLDALDWEASSTADFVKNRIGTHLQSGEIILMHVGDDITGQILDEVFTKIEADGYKIVGLSEGLK